MLKTVFLKKKPDFTGRYIRKDKIKDIALFTKNIKQNETTINNKRI